MKLYVASSWRNPYQQTFIESLRTEGHQVYDFRNPGKHPGFSWTQIASEWKNWTPQEYIQALDHPKALTGFANDFLAMRWADALIVLLPCGRSAHLEAGWAIGQGKPTCIFLDNDYIPELMYKMADCLATNFQEIKLWLDSLDTTKINQ